MYTSSGLRVRQQHRLHGFDYGGGATYHVTINTYGKRQIFGTCDGSTVALSDIGTIVQNHWLATQTMRPNVVLDEYQVMPNHIHAIIHIAWQGPEPPVDPLHRKLFRIVGGFKSGVTSAVRRLLSDPGYAVWQASFHDRVIRNDAELEECRNYIRDNPAVWSFPDWE